MSDIYQRSFIADLDGKPIENGQIYIGAENQDPETDPITVYWDEALTTPAAQPIAISGGYVWNAGTRADVYTASSAYSLRIRDRHGDQVDYIASATSIYSPGGAATIGTLDGPLQTALNERPIRVTSRTALKALNVNRFAMAFLDEDFRQGFFLLKAGSAPSDAQEGLYVASNTSGYYWARVWDGVNGRPEWFGALSGVSTGSVPADNLTALYACINHCPTTLLANAIYYFSSTVVLNTPFVSIKGTTPCWSNGGARFVSIDPDNDVVRVAGTDDIEIEHICAMWSTSPTIGGSSPSDRTAAPKAWNFSGTTSGRVKGLVAINPLIGFWMNSTSALHMDDCRVRRDSYLGANDFFVAFWARGTPRIGAGGNASLYMSRCHCAYAYTGTDAISNPTAFYADYDFADTYLTQFESAATPIGIVFDGASSAYSGGHGDVSITDCVVDQCLQGIDIRTTNPLAKIQINGGYVQANEDTVSGGNAAVHLRGGNGKITLSNIQITGATAATNTTSHLGIWVNGQPNVTIDPTVIIESFGYGLTIDGASARFWAAPNIDAGNLSGTGHTAARVTAGFEGYLAPAIAGAVNAWGRGIELLATANDKIVVDPTRIDSSACVDGKLFVNGVHIVAPGYFTAAGGAGTAGAGICVQGITA